MNTLTAATSPPTLPAPAGQWRAIYWEPVMATGERICVGFLTTWDGQSKAVLTVRPDLLSTLFGAARQGLAAWAGWLQLTVCS